MLLHICLLHLVACLTCQDNELSHYILSAQVDTWIRLTITLLLCPSYGFRKWHVSRNLIEDEVQRTTQHGFYLQYLIAGVSQVLYRAYDWQASSYVCLEKEFHSTPQGGLL